jgi:CHAT domain-containing protein
MYRGYLLLGGAEHTLAAWKEGTVVAFSEDGILTAEEVAGLDLRGTWLTVLSSCRSGAGDAMTGEGVLGLRRGFALAGTENLLFSLWSVDDDATARFMEAFYGRLFQNGDMVRAFQETQATQLRQWRETLSLREGRGGRDAIGTAVRLAGAFVLSGSTRRNADASPEDAASPAASSH